MREKWNKQQPPNGEKDGQPVPQRFNVLSEPMYKPKLLLKSPSMRALTNYNNLSIANGTDNTYDNLNFIPENGYLNTLTYDEPYTTSITSNTFSDSKNGIFPNTYDLYDYTTIGSASVKTNTSNGSELDSEKNEMGSTAKLVNSRMGLSCQTWFAHLETVLCTLSVAAGFGNLYRLPQQVLIRGGIPFLVAYVILTVLIGLPLLFLELGIGQLAQEGFIKSWRAVPFFKGVGFVKLIAGCLLSIYYPLYMGLCLYYIIWLAKGSLPFQECSHVKMKETGYSAHGILGQPCLSKTFLESPFEDPYWYGIFAAILLLIWIVVTFLSIRRTKSFIRSLSILLLPVLGCLIALTVKSVYVEDNLESIENVNKQIDWSVLKSANVWYYAAIQVFFSTCVGFGSFITNAGIMYNKVNPLWTALGYITVNLLYGIGAVFMCYILSGNTDQEPTNDIAELHLITLMYSALIKSEDAAANRGWAIIAYAALLLSGFISMATLTYTLLKAITVQNKRRLKWWQTSIVLSFIGLVLGCAILLKPNFLLVHLLDHYIVGNLILITVILEVFAFIAFYGTERIKSDFEFMLGHILSNMWLIVWWTLPILLTGILIWALCTLKLTGILQDDPVWLYGTGWGVVIIMTIFIFVVALYTMTQQDGYTFTDKLKASLKPSNNWGPKDPMLRHTWVQWNSKAQQGERDFTLKRKGTRDYTRSIKKNAKKAELQANSDLTTIAVSDNINQKANSRTSNASSNGYIEPYYVNNSDQQNTLTNEKPLRITSLIDGSIDSPCATYIPIRRDSYERNYRTNLNPLSRPQSYSVELDDSEDYGTFRKGPYVIPGTNIKHVCHRRYSQGEDATAL